MDRPQVLKPFPVRRYIDYSDFRYYYGYGNTSAEDLLECLTGMKFPSVLLLGCGDIRSCFYTLWKHFSSVHRSDFTGVKFDLVDYSAAVLARNIVFLYLCLQKPTGKDEIKKWVAAIWAIWFCHELSEEHVSILNDALVKLGKWSSSIRAWSESKDNPLRNIVQFGTENTLHEVAAMWKRWLENECPSVDAMNEARKELQKKKMKMIKAPGIVSVCTLLSHLLMAFTDEKRKIMEAECNSYFENGSVFAETILGLSLSSKLTVNATMYEKLDWDYTMHYASLPYKCFPAPFIHAPNKKTLKKNGIPKAVLDQIVVSDNAFETSPLLASAMQYFSLWLISSSEILANVCSKQSPSIVFNCVLSDAVEFCQTQIAQSKEPIFDLIHASNLIDHISLPNLGLLTIPLLKTSGYMITSTFLYKEVSPTISLYLEKCFGFKSHLLPLVCGVRCINHEDKYSSPVSISCKPPSIAGIDDSIKILVWQKVAASSFKMDSLQQDSALLKALYNSICTAVLSFNQQPSISLAPVCSGTALMIVQSFVDRIDDSLKPLPFSFWEPLCSLLRRDDRLKPHLVSLQVQALLNAFHFHLVVSESDCPLCKGKPVSSFLSQFTVSLNLPLYDEHHYTIPTPCVMVYIHKYSVSNIIQCHLQGDSDVHIMDSIGGTIDDSNNTLSLSFFAPSCFVDENLNMSIRSFILPVNPTKTSFFMLYKVLESGKLVNYSAPKAVYSSTVQTAKSTLPLEPSTLGIVDQHIGTGEEFDTIVSLSDSARAALAKKAITTAKVSDSEIKVTCGKCNLKIKYPYRVDKNSVKIVHQSPSRIHVKISRCSHVFHEEVPFCTVDPSNRITLIPFCCSPTIGSMYSLLQFSSMKEKQTLWEINTGIQSHSNMPVLFNLKSTIIIIFQHANIELIGFKLTDTNINVGVAIVQSHVFDLQKKTIALDLYYHFIDRVQVRGQLLSRPIDPATVSQSIFVDDKELEVLKKTFAYFAKCTTIQSSRPANKLLSAFRSDVQFRRAVVYPLYPNSEYSQATQMGASLKVDNPLRQMEFKAQEQPHAERKRKCSNCGSPLSQVLKCGKCHEAYYCNKQCQRNDWPRHKKVCQYRK